MATTTTLPELLANIAADPAVAGESGEAAARELWRGYADRFAA